MFRPWASLLVVSLLLACADKHDASAESAPNPAAVPKPETAPPAPAKPTGPPKRLFTKRFVVNVRTAPDRDAFRLGYLRAGSLFTATTAEPVGFDKCRKGWFEIAETGGFVCSTLDMIAFEGKRLPERRAKQPDLTALLPYPYGFILRDNAPVYRRLPTDEEAAEFEGYKIPGAPPPPDAGTPSAEEGVASGEATPTPPTVAAVAALPVAPQAAGAPGSGSEEGEAEEEVQPTLDSLRGAVDSVLERRVMKGFYVSLDRDMRKNARRYWRTQANGFIPYRLLREIRENDFRGTELSRAPIAPPAVPAAAPAAATAVAASPTPVVGAATAVEPTAPVAADAGIHLPIGFIISSKSFAYPVNKQGRPHRGRLAGYHLMFPIVGQAQVGGVAYEIAADGTHYRSEDVTRIDAREKPAEVGADEKWIDVDLTKQTLVAYEGNTPVYATLISSGRVKDQTDPLQNFATPTGDFRILSKHMTHTMDGDHAVDGPYSIEDVPYVMYFQLAYAIHSAFWHNSFGWPKSHGCVNAAPFDARWLFNWVTPELPAGWHASYPRAEAPGTRLYIRGEAPTL